MLLLLYSQLDGQYDQFTCLSVLLKKKKKKQNTESKESYRLLDIIIKLTFVKKKKPYGHLLYLKGVCLLSGSTHYNQNDYFYLSQGTNYTFPTQGKTF